MLPKIVRSTCVGTSIFSLSMSSRALCSVTHGAALIAVMTTPSGKFYKTAYIRIVHEPVIISTILGMEAYLLPLTKRLLAWHPYAKTGQDFENVITNATNKRLETESTANDIMSKLLVNNKGESTGLSRGEILAEANVMMNAETDTTTAALTNTIFLIYKHPDVLAQVRDEVDSAAGENEFLCYNTASQLPFLRACIEESLRLRPPSSFGLPRVVPKGGRVIAGKFIAENVTFSVPTYSLLHHAGSFEEPDKYNPDRWTTGDKEKMLKAHFPFSTGPRACIGRNIAYYEQVMVIANLFKSYDFEFEMPNLELEVIERFNSNPGELILKCFRRGRTTKRRT